MLSKLIRIRPRLATSGHSSSESSFVASKDFPFKQSLFVSQRNFLQSKSMCYQCYILVCGLGCMYAPGMDSAFDDEIIAAAATALNDSFEGSLLAET